MHPEHREKPLEHFKRPKLKMHPEHREKPLEHFKRPKLKMHPEHREKPLEHFKRPKLKMHPEHLEKPLEHFKRLKDKTSKTQEKSLDSMFKANTSMRERGLQVSYELSFLLAKNARPPHRRRGCAEARPGDLPQNDAEQPVAQELSAVPLSNDTVRRRIDDIADDMEVQLVTILRTTNFSLALDESTVRDCEALLLAYARFQHEFVEEMLFCKSLKTTTTVMDIYTMVKDYLSEKNIPISNIVSTAADGAPTMMDRRNVVLKPLKDDNPDMITVHSVIYRENLVAGSLSPELDQVIKGVIKVINFIKAHPKTEMVQSCCFLVRIWIRIT